MLAASVAGAIWAVFVFFTFVPTVDAVAYLAGAGRDGTFTVTGYSTSCTYSTTGSSCWSQADGYVEPGGAAATWPGDAPAGATFPVRLPLLDADPGTPVLFTTGLAVLVALWGGAVQLLCWGGLWYAAYRILKHRMPAARPAGC
jgi:hypothetical protein